MPNILTINDFVGEYNVPNVTGTSPAVSGNLAELNRFIAIYEREYLIKILQPKLYEAFMRDMDVVEDETIEQRWIDLKDRLKNLAEGVSPVTGYVYYHWARNRVTQTAALGEVETKSENATVVVGEKMMRAYNHSVHAGKEVHEWLVEHAKDYPEFDASKPYPLKTINGFNL